jgi:hypothetical protein
MGQVHYQWKLSQGNAGSQHAGSHTVESPIPEAANRLDALRLGEGFQVRNCLTGSERDAGTKLSDSRSVQLCRKADLFINLQSSIMGQIEIFQAERMQSEDAISSMVFTPTDARRLTGQAAHSLTTHKKRKVGSGPFKQYADKVFSLMGPLQSGPYTRTQVELYNEENMHLFLTKQSRGEKGTIMKTFGSCTADGQLVLFHPEVLQVYTNPAYIQHLRHVLEALNGSNARDGKLFEPEDPDTYRGLYSGIPT